MFCVHNTISLPCHKQVCLMRLHFKKYFSHCQAKKFQVRYLVLFLLSPVIDSFRWFWMGTFHKNIWLMLEFLKDPFLVVQFSYYILMTFLMMLFVTMLPMLMMLLSTLNVIKHQMWPDLWQQLELASELEPDLWDAMDWCRKCLFECWKISISIFVEIFYWKLFFTKIVYKML